MFWIKESVLVGENFVHEDENLRRALDLDFNANSKIDVWVKENPVRHSINSWALNRISKANFSKLVEVGGGESYFSRFLSSNFNYFNIDFYVHGKPSSASENFFQGDWRDYEFENDTLLVSLDLFPNVDQGLTFFLEKTKSVSEMILSFTCYEDFKFYRAKRIDGDEILTLSAWNLEMLQFCMSKFVSNPELLVKNLNHISPFNNSRDVYLVHLVNE